MSELQTDEEKVEAIRKWWKENGTSVVAGVAIGLGAVIGWQQWGSYQDRKGQQASAAFEQLLIAAPGEAQSALKQAELIQDQHGSTPYASFATLVTAKVKLHDGDTAGAKDAYQQVIDRAPDPGLSRIATLRLARLLLSEGAIDEAAEIVTKSDDGGSFTGDFAALRGDIAVARQQLNDARQAYQQALDTGAALPELIQLKLDNLPPAG